MESKKPRLIIGLCLIATGKYDQFLQPLLESVEEHFFKNSDIVIYLFTDKEHIKLKLSSRMSLVITPIRHEPWPASTLFRYRHFVSAAHKMAFTNYLFYLDVDMMIVSPVTDDIISNDVNLVVTRHPGFWNNSDWGSHNCSKWSKAYLREDERHQYVCGGFNGGKTDKFLEMSRILADNIDDDYSRGTTAEHNDENHLNWFINKHRHKEFKDWGVTFLSPSFCMVPEKEAQIKFGLTELEPVIYALSKNHEELRK